MYSVAKTAQIPDSLFLSIKQRVSVLNAALHKESSFLMHTEATILQRLHPKGEQQAVPFSGRQRQKQLLLATAS